MTVVLDASAILALMFDEEGAGTVERHLEHQGEIESAAGVVCVVNLVEILELVPQALTSPLFGAGLVEVVGVTVAQAQWAAAIRQQTRPAGLSLADRVCLAVAHDRRQEVLTADRAWDKADLGVRVIQIR